MNDNGGLTALWLEGRQSQATEMPLATGLRELGLEI